MAEVQYGPISRFLHRLALGNRTIAEASFDIEMATRKHACDAVVNQKHVFIAGLARAGTTVLMRRFFSSGAYRSLTYRDMPFVLMPNIWSHFSALSQKSSTKQERAHGDGLMVDYDSPEALEEVFWRVFAGNEYIRDDRLVPMEADDETIDKFRSYVAAILASAQGGDSLQYLSKNNNNILRLTCIREAFPKAILIVPFRDPVQHAYSLLQQHRRFTKMHQSDPFSRSYMRWLVHHEFGLDHRPFHFVGGKKVHKDPYSLNYWLELWLHTYGWLVENAPVSVIYQSYEDLCADVNIAWARLTSAADISSQTNEADVISIRTVTVDEPIDPGLSRQAEQLYVRLSQ